MPECLMSRSEVLAIAMGSRKMEEESAVVSRPTNATLNKSAAHRAEPAPDPFSNLVPPGKPASQTLRQPKQNLHMALTFNSLMRI